MPSNQTSHFGSSRPNRGEIQQMRDGNKMKDHRPMSMEEQQKEASQDGTGKIRRYLDLAEKLFKGDDDPTQDAA